MKIKNMLARVIVNLVNSSGYSFTAFNGENLTSVEHLQEFGFASKKPDGEKANGIALFYGGDRGNSSLLVLEVPKFKPDLSSGEAALFDAFGSLIKLTGGTIQLNGTDNEGLIKINELTTKLNDFITLYNSHIHPHGIPNTSFPVTLATEPFYIKTDYENDKVVH